MEVDEAMYHLEVLNYIAVERMKGLELKRR